MVGENNKIFHIKRTEQFFKHIPTKNKKQKKKLMQKPVDFSNIPSFPSPISSRSSKEELSKLKFHGKNNKAQLK